MATLMRPRVWPVVSFAIIILTSLHPRASWLLRNAAAVFTNRTQCPDRLSTLLSNGSKDDRYSTPYAALNVLIPYYL